MGVSWLKTGAESANLAKQQAAEVEKMKQEAGKMFRFWMKDGDDAQITFIDGDLSPEGFLLPPRFYEHNIFANGSYNNYYVCPEKTNPGHGESCPLCEGQDKPSLVALFTVIDHRSYTGKNGKEYKDTRKILAAKPQSFELLNKLALKLGGLAGQRFDVSRQGDKSASIGSIFLPMEKKPIADLQEQYKHEVKDDKGKTKILTYFLPADYDAEIVYRTGDELRKLGFGKPVGTGIKMPGSMQPSQGKTDYDAAL